MPRQPKQFYSDAETRKLIDQYTPYLKSLYVPAEAVRGIIRALLKAIPNAHLNRQAAEDHLMAELLHDNHELEEAKKRSETYSEEIQSADEAASAEQFMASIVCGGKGEDRVTKVLQEYSSHSVDRMRQESDEILKILEKAPLRNLRDRTKWINANIPKLLQSFKLKHACFMGCRANSEWPPKDKETLDRITSPDEGCGAASIKNEILAYFHSLDALTVRHYLEGIRPKTVSRSSQPLS